jgi:hypothetical protein
VGERGIAEFRRPDGSEVVREFSPKEQPYGLVMPIWTVPGITLGKRATVEFETAQGHVYLFTSPEIQKWIDDEDLKLGVWPYVNYATFGRAIARISFCQAVAQFGLDGFNHLDLPALILGTYPNVSHYVGVTRDLPSPPDERNVAHKIELQGYTINEQPYWLASMRLFAHSGYKDVGMPIYRTIVGRAHRYHGHIWVLHEIKHDGYHHLMVRGASDSAADMAAIRSGWADG